MSGAEILGLASSVIAIAELGGKLSVKIFTFTFKVKNANKTIDALSKEIAMTGAVIQQLGKTLSTDTSVKMCSKEALDTATLLVSDTEKVFRSLDKLLDIDENTTNKLLKAINLKRLKFPFLESEIEQLQVNLERLKSSLLVILNVLVLAQLLKSREAEPVLEEQRDLIRKLVADQHIHEQHYENLLKAIKDRPKTLGDDAGNGSGASIQNFDAGSVNSTALTLVNTGDHATQPSNTTVQPSTIQKVSELPVLDLPDGLKHQHERIHHHTHLIQNLLLEIDCLEYKLDHSVRGRLQTGVLDMHWTEWSLQRRRFGNEPMEEILASSTEVARYWADKLIEEDEEESDRHSRPSRPSRRSQEQVAKLKAMEEYKARERHQKAEEFRKREEAEREEYRRRELRKKEEYDEKYRMAREAARREEELARERACRMKNSKDDDRDAEREREMGQWQERRREEKENEVEATEEIKLETSKEKERSGTRMGGGRGKIYGGLRTERRFRDSTRSSKEDKLSGHHAASESSDTSDGEVTDLYDGEKEPEDVSTPAQTCDVVDELLLRYTNLRSEDIEDPQQDQHADEQGVPETPIQTDGPQDVEKAESSS